MNDVIINKSEIIERCVQRINEVYQNDPENLKDDTKQDSIILNIQRACEACIDLAMHLVSLSKMGIPQHSRDAFEMLYKNEVLSESLSDRMKAMVGFRNIAVHNYQAINLNVIEMIIKEHLDDILEFKTVVLREYT